MTVRATPTQYLVRGDGAPPSRAWRTESWVDPPIHIDTVPGPRTLAKLVMPRFEQTVLGHLTDRSEDLVRIACTIFLADQAVSRGGVRDVHDDAWSRRFGLCLGVRDLPFWSQPEVQTRLAALIRYATDDHWRFHFSALHEQHAGQITLGEPFGDHELHEHPGCVVLFSGGIDSLATLAEAAATGERPLAISQWGDRGAKQRQRQLLDLMRTWMPYRAVLQGWSFPWAPLEVHGTMPDPPERTRRSRAVLFACLGAVAAGHLGIERVYLADNGPVSLNLPINDQIIGAHASRSTHPKFLERVNDLMELVYDTPVRVSNPLWNRTRAETITILKDVGLEALLAHTLSCSNWSRLSGETPQCGYCSQCIDRRIAMVVTGMERFEPGSESGSGYKHDVFRHRAPTDEGALMALSYLRFAQTVSTMDDLQILAAFPQLLEAAGHPGLSPDQVIAELIDLVQRHAKMVLDGRQLLELGGDQARRLGQQDPFSVLTMSASPARLWILDEEPGAEGRLTTLAVPKAPECIFAREGDTWTLTFAGCTVHMKHARAMPRIAYLLANPGTEIKPLELLAFTEGPTVTPLPQISAADANDAGLAGEGRGSATQKTSWDDLKGIDAEIAALTEELDFFKELGWASEQVEPQAKLDALLAERDRIEAATPKPKKKRTQIPKHERDAYERAKDNVYQSLRRKLRQIKAQHPDLGAHFDEYLHVGAKNVYQPPDDDPPWVTSLLPEKD